MTPPSQKLKSHENGTEHNYGNEPSNLARGTLGTRGDTFTIPEKPQEDTLPRGVFAMTLSTSKST